MAGNQVFDRTIINSRERPLSSDINQLESQIDRTQRELMRALGALRISSTNQGPLFANAFIGQGFQVLPTSGPSMSVLLKAGYAFLEDNATAADIDGIVHLDDLSKHKPLVLSADQTIDVDAGPGPGNARIDIIEVRWNRFVTNPLTRDVLDPGTGAFVPTVVDKTLTWDLAGLQGRVVDPADSTEPIGYKVGTAYAGSAYDVTKVPPTSPGYFKIAEILVVASPTTLDLDVISDWRPLYCPNGVFEIGTEFYVGPTGGTAVTIDVIAPPGVRIATTPIDGFSGFFVTYILAGSGFTKGVANAAVSFNDAYPIVDPITPLLDVSSFGPLDAAGVTALASVGVKAAEGQVACGIAGALVNYPDYASVYVQALLRP